MTGTDQQSARRSVGHHCIENARVVTPGAVVEGGVRIEGDRIVAVGEDVTPCRGDAVVDAAGRYLLPGLVDLHGDDIESQLRPRNGARMDTAMALAAADRANVAAGITTKYHAIAFENDEDEGRSTELAADLTDAVEATDSLLADHRIHVRSEVTQEESIRAATAVLDREGVDLVSVMSHVPGKGQFRDVEAFKRFYRESEDHSVSEAEALIERRASVSLAEIREGVDRVLDRAQECGVVTASHDDEDPQEVERLHERGVDIAEYPITLETARRAHELDMTTVMGAPNLVRGESQWGNLESREAIDRGVLDALCVDYHPPSLLAAPFVDTGEPLPERVARVTKHPAAAVGLDDRGRIEAGARADLVLVDAAETPTVERAFVAGTDVYRAAVTR